MAYLAAGAIVVAAGDLVLALACYRTPQRAASMVGAVLLGLGQAFDRLLTGPSEGGSSDAPPQRTARSHRGCRA
jgi:hypothetical protein